MFKNEDILISGLDWHHGVKMTHIPTGISMYCDSSRSKHRNREIAYKLLTQKVLQMNDEILGKIREAFALCHDEVENKRGSREIALTITKLEEAVFWRERDLQLKHATNEKSSS